MMIRLLFLLVALPSLFFAQNFPKKPVNYVTNLTNSISDSEVSKLNKKLKAFEDSTTNQIFIYIDYSLNGADLEQFSQDLFHKWKIGQNEKNNGVLITVFIDEHKFRVHVGYGLEGSLPDLLTKKIQDEDMRPFFKQNRYYEGLDVGTDKLMYYTKHEYVAEDTSESNYDVLAFFYVFSAMLLLVTFLIARKIKDKPTAKKVIYIIGSLLFLLPFIGSFFLIILVFVAVSFRKDLVTPGGGSYSGGTWSSSDSSSSWSSSDYSSDSGSSSDFSGGGGGDSGGGGSSSDW